MGDLWGAHLDRHGLCNFGFLVFWFSMKKPKNQKTKIAQTMGDLWGAHLDRHGLCNFGFLVFWFSMKKPKKQKTKIAQTMGDLWGDTYMHMYYRKSKKQI